MAGTQIIRVMAVQPALRWLQPMPNMHLLRQLIEKSLTETPADLLVLPEVFNGIPCDYDSAAGPVARKFLSTLAKACNIAVVGGSIDYAHEDGKRNTCFVIDSNGNELGSYHKHVLFANELHTRKAGSEPGIFELAGLRVGVMICADLWDPCYLRELVGRVDLLCVAAKTTVTSPGYIEYARQLWQNLALTRAMENGLPMVISDWAEARHQADALSDGTRVSSVHYTSGAASITDPSQRPDIGKIQKALPGGKANILYATIDLEAVAKFREYRQSVGLLPKKLTQG